MATRARSRLQDRDIGVGDFGRRLDPLLVHVLGEEAQGVEGRDVGGIGAGAQGEIRGDAHELANLDRLALAVADRHRSLEALTGGGGVSDMFSRSALRATFEARSSSPSEAERAPRAARSGGRAEVVAPSSAI